MEKDFAKSMAEILNLAPKKSRAGVITYSSLPKTVSQLRGHTPKEFERVLARAELHGDLRSSRIDLAVERAAKELRIPGRNQNKVVVILTARRQGRGTNSLRDSVQPLRDEGADVYVVTIGSDPNFEELLPLVIQPDDIFKVPSYQELLKKNGPISTEIARRTGMYAIESGCCLWRPDFVYIYFID